MKIFLAASLLFICFNLSAQESEESVDSSSRTSSVSYTLDVGANKYKNHTIAATYGIDSQWAIGINLSSSKDDSNSEYQAGSLFASSYWNDYFSNKIVLRSNKEKPEELLGRGFDLQTKVQYPLFNEDLYSSLAVTFGRMNYQQTITTTNILGAVRTDINFVQSFVTFTLEQDITEWLSIGLSSTKYSYEDVSQATFTGKNNRFSASTGLDSTSDYPDQKSSLWLIGSWDHFEVDLSGSVTKSKLADNNSKSKSLFVTWIINEHWSTTIGIDSVTYDSTTSKSDTGSLGFQYSF